MARLSSFIRGVTMDLEAFLGDVITPLLDHPEAFRVEVSGEGRKRELLVYTDPRDRGRVIGKHGRMISALRTLCRTAGDKAGLSVDLELYDEDGTPEA